MIQTKKALKACGWILKQYQAFFVITCLSLPHISSYYFFRINFHSFHVTLTMQCWQMKATNIHCNYLRLQSPAPYFFVVFYLLSLPNFLILAHTVFYYLLGHTYTCTITTHKQEKQCYVSAKQEYDKQHKH